MSSTDSVKILNKSVIGLVVGGIAGVIFFFYFVATSAFSNMHDIDIGNMDSLILNTGFGLILVYYTVLLSIYWLLELDGHEILLDI